MESPVQVDDEPKEPSPRDLDVFRREGDYWSVAFEARTVRMRDLKGMRYLARLLTDPEREFHVLDLVAAEAARPAQTDHGTPAGPSHIPFGDAGEVLDAQAKDAYRRRLAEIDDDLERAQASGDTERAAQADIDVRARSSRSDPGGPPGHGPDRRAPALVIRPSDSVYPLWLSRRPEQGHSVAYMMPKPDDVM